MDKSTKKAVSMAVDSMAVDLKATWDAPLNWLATASALVDVIVNHGDDLDPVSLATLLGAASMARRQSLHEPGHAIVIRSKPCDSTVIVDVQPIPLAEDHWESFRCLTDAYRYARSLSQRSGWPIRDEADRDYVS